MTLPHDELGAAWRAARPPQAGTHLDSAACGRQSSRVLAAVAAHARHEAEIGGYVAEAAAEPLLRQGRAGLAELLGAAADDVAFVESASVALPLLLDALTIPAGATVAAVPGEWGPNLLAFADRGLTVRTLPVDDWGRVDLAALPPLLADAPALLHLTPVAAHRGVLQPTAAVVAACREAGVAVVLDVAQALGHVDVDVLAGPGRVAAYGTARKWLAGPRGVGFLVVRPDLAAHLRPLSPALRAADWPDAAGLAPARRLESREAHIAGRVGLALAVGEHLAAGPARVARRLGVLGPTARTLLHGAGGWRVLDPPDEPVAIVTLAPPAGVSVAATRHRLLRDAGIVTSRSGPERAPGELTAPVLRVSPHIDATVEDIETLARALAA